MPHTHREAPPSQPTGPGRLAARPVPLTEAGPPGLHPLGLGEGRGRNERDGLLYVPDGYDPERPAPLALLFHGAGAEARQALGYLRGAADAAGLLILAPDSRGRTWDLVLGRFGPDVALVDRALAETFRRYAVDPGRLAVGGFSDGASYALSLGLTNGDLFSHVVAFSPGFMAPAEPRGRPCVFVSHGTEDPVLPVERCSRRLVSELRRGGYDTTYQEFDGGHEIAPAVALEAAAWYLGAQAVP
jgi:phospholipase/carboxylesterase